MVDGKEDDVLPLGDVSSKVADVSPRIDAKENDGMTVTGPPWLSDLDDARHALASLRFFLLDSHTMSLQRIFESARKLGLPVIVTDVAGREPMVVLPLEQFEAMSESGSDDFDPDWKLPDFDEKGNLISSEDPLPKAKKTEEPISVELPDEFKAEPQDLSLEERFYLEPVDDGKGI